MAGNVCAKEVCMSNVLKRIKDSLRKHSESVKMSSRTSALWVQYMNKIDIPTQIHQSRTHWKLGIVSTGNPGRHASLHGSLWPQLLQQVCNGVSAADVRP